MDVLMNKLDDAVYEWVAKVEGQVAGRSAQTIHLDELTRGSVSGERITFSLALRAFSVLVACLHEKLESLTPVLILPLESAGTLSVDCPPWEYVALFKFQEPPSLGVIHSDALRLIDRAEEYRRFVSVPEGAPCPLAATCVAYYRCFRPILGVVHEWEYERCMIIEVVPKDRIV
jgi:hypothetical protein